MPKQKALRGAIKINLAVSPVSPLVRVPEEDVQTIPYQDLSPLMREAIEEALLMAWSRLPVEAQAQGVDLMNVGEEPLTRLFRDELDKLRLDNTEPVPGFTEAVFQHMPESEGVPNFTGLPDNANTKYPDLVFRPVRRPAGVIRTVTYGIFVECKIIHKSTDHHSVKDYCKHGIRRFVAGEYAWMMPRGIMIGYVRDDKDIPGALTTFLQDSEVLTEYQVLTLPKPSQRNAVGLEFFTSTHGRSNVIIGQSGRSPGNIELLHVWLHVV